MWFVRYDQVISYEMTTCDGIRLSVNIGARITGESQFASMCTLVADHSPSLNGKNETLDSISCSDKRKMSSSAASDLHSQASLSFR